MMGHKGPNQRDEKDDEAPVAFTGPGEEGKCNFAVIAWLLLQMLRLPLTSSLLTFHGRITASSVLFN